LTSARRRARGCLDGPATRRCLASDVDFGIGTEELDEPCAHEIVVVGD
jgi:hypothetical protein